MEGKVLILDNYDSFTYNLVHQVSYILNDKVTVRKNDAITVEEAAGFQKILLSPGPGLPQESGIMNALIKTCAATHSILGVCLGHQAIAEVFGGTLKNTAVYHGIQQDVIYNEGAFLFSGVPNPFPAGRYHSWMVSETALPADLKVTARDASGNIMGISHRIFDVHGVQFHPESIMTPNGMRIISNWLNA